MWLFKKQKTPQELLRENKRMLDRSIREIDRERSAMMSQEKKLIAEIKRVAKANQMGAVKVRAWTIVREGENARCRPRRLTERNERASRDVGDGEGFSAHETLDNEVLCA